MRRSFRVGSQPPACLTYSGVFEAKQISHRVHIYSFYLDFGRKVLEDSPHLGPALLLSCPPPTPPKHCLHRDLPLAIHRFGISVPRLNKSRLKLYTLFKRPEGSMERILQRKPMKTPVHLPPGGLLTELCRLS